MEKLYNRIDFHNDTVPALNDANLNAMSKAIDDLDNRIINLPVVITEESIEKAEAAAARAEEVLESIPSDYSALSAEVQRKADVSALATKADVSALATKADKTQLSNRNLLDNAWFTVNQRGATRFAGVYGCDRWKAIIGYLNVNDNGITFLGKDELYHEIVLDQMLETHLEVGQEYTISLKIGNEIFSETVTFGSGAYTQIGNSGLWINRDFTDRVRLYNYDGTTDITVRAVKLEKGSISTLANDVVPNYAEELIKCQGSTADSSDTYANDNHKKVIYAGTVLGAPSNGKVQQQITIPTSGNYLIISELRAFGGSGTYPTQVNAYKANIGEGDDPIAGGTLKGTYGWVSLPRIEHLNAGVNTFTYKVDTNPTTIDVRTNCIRLY